MRDLCVLPWRKRALALAYLLVRGDVVLGPGRLYGLPSQLQGLGFSRSSAFRWAADYRRWVEAGKP